MDAADDASVLPVLAGVERFRILAPRDEIEVSEGNVFRPDLTLVEVETGKPWLIAEVIDTADHMPDTVAKKDVFADVKLPRLWLVDPRYDNVEVHEASSFGITLRGILAGSEVLEEEALPGFRVEVKDLFGGGTGLPL